MAGTESPIAIVGMACCYPDANTPEELFENVLAGRRAFRRIPDVRLPLDDYGSSDPEDVDSTYVTQAALIEGYEFDRVRFKIVGSTYRAADLTHWLALDVADRALRDAGFEGAEGLPRDTTGVLLGNTLTGEFSRAQALRLRWPYVKSVVAGALDELLPGESERANFLDDLEARFKAPFEAFGDESLAGGLSNTIAGRICNYFDLHGGGYTIDGACSSALLAVANACNSIASGDLDVAIAGGVDLSLDPFELVGFSRAGALARSEMRVYDERSEGFWPGEGCGFVVLMRESDALAQGRHVHARIRGWGISSDGAGGISRPDENGQLLAMRRAYSRAGFGPESIGYFEGHGTGTVVGDATELAALTRLLRENPSALVSGASEPVAIGSIKANIGHTKAAAGVAGLIKAALAVRQQIVPGMPGCERPHERVDPRQDSVLFVPSRATSWSSNRELRAGVSSMGFGGINAHVVIDASAVSRRPKMSSRATRLTMTGQDAELFLISAPDRHFLRSRVVSLLSIASSLSRAELIDLASTLAGEISDDFGAAESRVSSDAIDRTIGGAATFLRAAVVASRPDELASRLQTLLEWIDEGPESTTRISVGSGVYLGNDASKPSIGFLFPGQGAPVYEGLGTVGDRCPGAEAAELALEYGARASSSLAAHGQAEPVDTSVAQPAIVAASLATVEALSHFGVDAEMAVGHSLGEITALCWAEALSVKETVQLAELRGRIMAEYAQPGGTMASLPVSAEQARLLIGNEKCSVAGHNGPTRSAISGPEDAIERVLARARHEGIPGVRLKVSHAFHSSMVEPCAEPLRRALAMVPFRPVEREIVSTRTGAILDRSCDLSTHLVEQLTEPVQFAEAINKTARSVELMIEVGPGRMLSSLAQEFVEIPTISIDTGSQSARGLLSAIAAAWALGAPIEPQRLFSGRICKTLELDREAQFFANPAARPVALRESAHGVAVVDEPGALGAPGESHSALDIMTRLVADRCELPVGAVGVNDRFLSDLHLTSIAVSSIASEVARELGRSPLVAPNEFADSTVQELAAAIDSDERVLSSRLGVPGVDAWLRAFEVCSVPRARPRMGVAAASKPRSSQSFEWQVFAVDVDPFADSLAESLRRDVAPGGILVHLPRREADANLPLLLAAAKASFEEVEARLVVVVHHGDPGTSVVRSLHQEANSLATRVIEVPDGHPEALDWVIAEAKASAGYLESSYDAKGERCERRLRVLPVRPIGATGLPLESTDVLLVSGGGKGIAAECALGLARESGCALAILGRSAPSDDDELAANLSRFRDAGIRTLYARADVVNRNAVSDAIDRIEGELGRVTALIHGAGVNVPKPLVALETADFARTLAPKLHGLEHMLDRLELNPLRFVVGFGSVIAELGLPGEADYAWANELMSRRIAAFARERSETRCLALEWSIWSGVGMGEKLGRVEALAAMNIAAISPDAGVDWLLELLRQPDLPVRTFLSGRFGAPPTLDVEEDAEELPIGRFLEHVREHTSGVELIVDAELSFETDPYLADHVYRGDAILPGVMGLESMAQVASALLGVSSASIFENVEFLQAVSVAPGEKRVVRVAGLVTAPGTVDVVLRSDVSAFQVEHLKATVRFEPVVRSKATLDVSRQPATRDDSTHPALDPARDLYGDLFFHQGRFQRVLGYQRLGSRGCEVEIARKSERFFGAFQPQHLWLGDAGARDAGIHAIQACVPEHDLLPVAVERIEVGRLEGDDPVWVRATERSHAAGEYVYDLDFLDEDDCVLESWRGLILREVRSTAPRMRYAAGLLAPRLEEVARENFADLGIRAAVVPGIGRVASERAVAIAAGMECALEHRVDGKPILSERRRGHADPQHVSLSHSAEHTLAVVAQEPVACDFEEVESRSADMWLDLLGPDRDQLARYIAHSRGEPFDTSATRVWGALESLLKLGMQRDAPLSMASDSAGSPDSSGAIVQLTSGSLVVVSILTEVSEAAHPMVLTLLARGVDARV